jgi:hypothetical protein
MRLQLLAVGVCSLLVAAGTAEDKPAPTDKDKIQGTWSLVSSAVGVKSVLADPAMIDREKKGSGVFLELSCPKRFPTLFRLRFVRQHSACPQV